MRKSQTTARESESLRQTEAQNKPGVVNLYNESFVTTATADAEAERRFSIDQEERYHTGSINSRKSINKKNLSILVPADAPGTEYNPDFRTPTDGKPNDDPAIAPFNSQIAAVSTQAHTL